LAWTPVKQLPESAVYDALKAANIPNIPLIIDSGIIIENSFGYRVEYLLIEDCGVPLVEYLQTQMLLGISKQSDIAASAMFQAVECIYSAWNAGILHRDITADSVVVKGDQVRIIDWGYTKLVKDGPVDVDALATKWLFNKDNATGDEGSSAPIIGTPLYTSIPVLVGATQRSIADDVDKSLALMRGGCLSDVDFYRQSFGVPYSSERFTWLTDTFREYLFIRNGEYIGSKLSTQSRFERTVEIQQLERILEQIKERIQSEARSQNAPSNTSRALGNIPDRNAPPATKHTLEEASSLALPVETPGAGTTRMPFGDSLPELQLGSKYDAFQHRFRGIFAAIALRTIAYMDGVAVQPTLADNTRTTIEAELTRDTTADDRVHAHLKCFNSFEALECIDLEGEAALINNFKGILYMARHAIAGLSSDERKMWPDNSYDYLFGSDDQISGQEHNIIHGVGYMKHITRHISSVHIPIVVQPATIDDEIPDSVFGEMADYAHAIWT
ncbi:hypothetical protein LPJ77_004526, partial [Coemansia sp. RSA 2523]